VPFPTPEGPDITIGRVSEGSSALLLATIFFGLAPVGEGEGGLSWRRWLAVEGLTGRHCGDVAGGDTGESN
jgi:hypothetical protein